MRQQQAQPQVDGDVEEGVDKRHLNRVEQVLGRCFGGEQPEPVFQAYVLIGAAGQPPVGEADVDEFGDGIIGGQNQQQHSGQRHEKIRPVVPFRAQQNLPTLNLDAATLLYHGNLSLKRRGDGQAHPPPWIDARDSDYASASVSLISSIIISQPSSGSMPLFMISDM